MFALAVLSVVCAEHELSVTSDPARASVFLDGRFAGVTPAKLTGVSAGPHFVKLTRHGYGNWAQVIRTPVERGVLHAKLEAASAGAIRVDSEPANADAYVNGEFRGRTPTVVEGLPIGQASIRVEKREYLPWTGTADASVGKTAEVSAPLKSRVETFLLEEIERRPEVVRNYTELGHFYITRHEFDRAFEAYAKGMDACVGPHAIPNDCMRHYRELNYAHGGTVFKLGDEKTMAELRERIAKLYEESIKRTPNNERSYWALISIKQQKGEKDEVLRLYEEALAHSRNDRIRHSNLRALAGILYPRAVVLQQEKKPEAAVAAYEAVAERCGPAPGAVSALDAAIKLCDSTLKDEEKSLALRRKYIRLFPNAEASRNYQLEIAERLIGEGKLELAIREYEAFLELFAGNDQCPELYLTIAETYETKLGSIEKALPWYLSCVRTFPEFDGCARALKAASAIWERLGKSRKARKLRAILVRDYPRSEEAGEVADPAAQKARAEATRLHAEAHELEPKDIAKAIAAYEEMVNRFPRTSLALKAQSRVVELHQGKSKDFGKEVAARSRQVEVFADSDEAPAWLVALAGRYAAQGEHEKAIEVYRRLIAQYPESDLCPAAQQSVADTYHRTLFSQLRAAEEYRRSARDYPNDPGAPAALYQLGWIYLFHVRDKREEGIAAFREVLTKYPLSAHANSVEIWYDAFRTERPE